MSEKPDAVPSELRRAATEAQRHLSHLEVLAGGAAMGHHARLFMGLWSYTFLLDAFARVNPQAAAESVEQMQGILSDGGAADQWLWEQLVKAGIDPDQVDPLTCCKQDIATPTAS